MKMSSPATADSASSTGATNPASPTGTGQTMIGGVRRPLPTHSTTERVIKCKSKWKCSLKYELIAFVY